MTRRMRWLLAAVGLVTGLGAVLLTGTTLQVRPARVESFQRTGDARKIVANVVIGLDDEIVGSSAVEDATTVRVIVRVKPPAGPGFRPAIGIGVPVVVMLSDAIGSRTVLDASSGAPVRDLGMYQTPREPPIDLSTEVGQIDRSSFKSAGDLIDFRWTNLNGTKTASLGELRGSTVVVVSRTPNSGDAKLTMVALEAYLSSPPSAPIVVLVVTLTGDPSAATSFRPSASWRSLFVPTGLGDDAPEIFRLSAAPATWFIGPDGSVRQRYSKTPLTSEQVVQGIIAAR
jgi:hypothetical protein